MELDNTQVDALGQLPSYLRPYVLDMAASKGEMVCQGHADVCAAIGHGKNLRNGVEVGTCPRCGVVKVSLVKDESGTLAGMLRSMGEPDSVKNLPEVRVQTEYPSNTYLGKARGVYRFELRGSGMRHAVTRTRTPIVCAPMVSSHQY